MQLAMTQKFIQDFEARIIIAILLVSKVSESLYISNLSVSCMACLCSASSDCNLNTTCEEGYCGPFYISREYWLDANALALGSYQECSNDYECAKTIVVSYMEKFGKDCNGDGVTNCDDFAMIHHNGGYACETPLQGEYLNRYLLCRSSAIPDSEESRG